MTNYAKIIKLLKLEVQEAIDDQPDLDRAEVLEEILEGIKTDMEDDTRDSDEDDNEGFIDWDEQAQTYSSNWDLEQTKARSG